MRNIQSVFRDERFAVQHASAAAGPVHVLQRLPNQVRAVADFGMALRRKSSGVAQDSDRSEEFILVTRR
jgi:hypothetical protein